MTEGRFPRLRELPEVGELHTGYNLHLTQQ
jgi:hypothetical protein